MTKPRSEPPKNRIKKIALTATDDILTQLSTRVSDPKNVYTVRHSQIRRTVEKACIKSVETIAGEVWRK